MKVKCPNCEKWVEWQDNAFRPFCSDRCQKLDLGGWATEEYRVTCAEDGPSTEDEKVYDLNRLIDQGEDD